MGNHCFIVERKSLRSRYAYVITDHYDHSLESFQKTASMLRASFHDLIIEDSDIECRTVSGSKYAKFKPICSVDISGSQLTPPDFRVLDKLPDIQF